MKITKSRRKTPWDDKPELTATQAFLMEYYKMHYSQRHEAVGESGETDLINSYVPSHCPYCKSEKYKKNGHAVSGIQRYKCECGKIFIPTTGTIFDEHKISMSEWIEYCLNVFRHVSITAGSWNNKNAFTTSRYWLQKLFLTLEDAQKSIVLCDCVWLDETYYTVISEDVVRNEDGTKLRGISKNQIRIGVATDKQNALFFVEGEGKPSQKKTLETFKNHIKPGSTLVHDKEIAHSKLVKELELKSIEYSSKDLKGLPDKKNPMNPVNRCHANLKHFLNAHSGFDRDNLQHFLNLFSFVTNPPDDRLEKVELVLNLAFQNPKLLRYREFCRNNTDV